MNVSGLLLQLLNGLADASALFLVAAGLSLIFGVTRVVNFAHGSFYMLGIYLAWTFTSYFGGGAGYWQYTMHAAEQSRAALDHCAAAPVSRWVKSGTYEEVYAGCSGGAEVIGRIMVGETHHWIADNDAMWAFLSRFRR